ncbi:MAG: type II toxin-antitoxin system prevent-host-death family antitoxin [Pseudomonadota bacterium]
MQVNVHTAKTTLSDLILRAEAGEEVVIARRGKPAVKLVPVKQAQPRSFGRFKTLTVTGDVVGPLDDAELDLWDGE